MNTASHLNDLDGCTLHRRTPYGITNVQMTQFSIARIYGAIKFNGERYTYLPDTDELIRDDVLKWKHVKRMTFSARLNDDGSWRGLGWAASHAIKNPLVIVGFQADEYFWTRKEAIAAAKAAAEALKGSEETK